jgi:hypothetical protein
MVAVAESLKGEWRMGPQKQEWVRFVKKLSLVEGGALRRPRRVPAATRSDGLTLVDVTNGFVPHFRMPSLCNLFNESLI